MSITLPENVGYGKVVGRFLLAIADGPDADQTPDADTPVGTVTFTPSVMSVKNITATPPVELIPRPITCTVDSEGYVLAPNGQRGLWLVATDDTDNNPSGWTYTVTVIFPAIGYNRTYSIEVPEGVETDLAVASPVVSSPGNAVTVGPPGPAGVGVPAGGLAGQILARTEGPDYSVAWVDPPSGTGGTGDVLSVNGKTGIVVLNAGDIAPTTARRYLPSGGTENQIIQIVGGNPVWTTASSGAVSSVNGQTGAVTIDTDDVEPTTARRYLPSGGSLGQIVQVGASGPTWVTPEDVGSGLPSGGSDGQVIKMVGSTPSWADESPVDWSEIENLPTLFPPDAHDHDDRYYTESEVDLFLADKAPLTHSHTIASLPVATSGEVSSTKLVRADDARLGAVNAVSSVNGQTGAVVLNAGHIEPTSSRRYVPSGGSSDSFLTISGGSPAWGSISAILGGAVRTVNGITPNSSGHLTITPDSINETTTRKWVPGGGTSGQVLRKSTPDNDLEWGTPTVAWGDVTGAPTFVTQTAADAAYQPKSSTLTSIAATSPGADQLIYSADGSTYTVADLTPFARQILGAADAAATVALLDIEGGSGTGSQWLGGAVNPDAGNGAEGDWYVNTETWDVFRKTGPTTWTQVGNIQGGEGPQGDPGEDPHPIFVAPEGQVNPVGLPDDSLIFEYATV